MLIAQLLVGVLRTITLANVDLDRFAKSLADLMSNAEELQD